MIGFWRQVVARREVYDDGELEHGERPRPQEEPSAKAACEASGGAWQTTPSGGRCVSREEQDAVGLGIDELGRLKSECAAKGGTLRQKGTDWVCDTGGGGGGGGGGDGGGVPETQLDPALFDYTGGSLLTPYTTAPPSGGGPEPYDPYEQAQPGIPDVAPYETPDYDPNVPQLELPEYQQYEDFTAPTVAEAEADPSYKFRRQEGTRALDYAAAARGVDRGGNTWRALMDLGQGLATEQYDKVRGYRFQEHLAGRDEGRFAHGAASQRGLAMFGAENENYWRGDDRVRSDSRFEYSTNAQREAAIYQAQVAEWERGLNEHRYDYQADSHAAQVQADNEYRNWLAERDTFYTNQENQFRRLSYGVGLGAGLV